MALFFSLLETLRSREPLPPLFPKTVWQSELSIQITNVTDAELFGKENSTSDANDFANACRAGLLLWNDDLEASHNIAQNIENSTGSYWHAIIHRREGDVFNSNYWWNRTGAHPAFNRVLDSTLQTLHNESDEEARSFRQQLQKSRRWLPSEFVQACETSRLSNNDLWLRRIQAAELEALLHWCHELFGHSSTPV
jgi:hypothetical protein